MNKELQQRERDKIQLFSQFFAILLGLYSIQIFKVIVKEQYQELVFFIGFIVVYYFSLKFSYKKGYHNAIWKQ